MGMIKTASRIIARLGQAAEIVRPGEETGPENNPVIGPPTYHSATVAVVDYDQTERDGTLIQTDDKRALVSVEGLEIVPTVADTLHLGGVDFAIVRVAPVAPDGVPRFYELQVRR